LSFGTIFLRGILLEEEQRVHMGRDRHCESPPGVVVEEDEEDGELMGGDALERSRMMAVIDHGILWVFVPVFWCVERAQKIRKRAKL